MIDLISKLNWSTSNRLYIGVLEEYVIIKDHVRKYPFDPLLKYHSDPFSKSSFLSLLSKIQNSLALDQSDILDVDQKSESDSGSKYWLIAQ